MTHLQLRTETQTLLENVSKTFIQKGNQKSRHPRRHS